MDRNHMNDVANMFGLKLGEKFDIEGNDDSPFYFTEKGIVNKQCKTVAFLESLIRGECKVVKKPWIPKNGDFYYYLITDDDGTNVESAYYVGNCFDTKLKRMGNFFRTYDEAEMHISKWENYIKQEPDFSWRE